MAIVIQINALYIESRTTVNSGATMEGRAQGEAAENEKMSESAKAHGKQSRR